MKISNSQSLKDKIILGKSKPAQSSPASNFKDMIRVKFVALASIIKKDQKRQDFNTPAIERRPSFEIARDYIEMNFRPIIEIDIESGLSKRQIKKRRKELSKNGRRSWGVYSGILVFLALFLFAVTSTAIWWKYSSDPVDVSRKGVRQFIVDKGASTSQVAQTLQKSGFIKSVLAFKIYIYLNGGTIQAGTHILSPSYSLGEVIQRLAKADNDEISVQIPPGINIKQLKTVLNKYDYTDGQIEQALKNRYDNSILKDKPQGSSLEGYIYPDTYRVLGRDDPDSVIKKSLDNLSVVNKAYRLKEGFNAHGLTFHQGLTLASIVTKEVQNKDDQKKVASVFYNRLAAGMNLGSDVTFMYAYKLGLCDKNSPKDCTSEYNTRIHSGLPPGPIANPSLSAMIAVANPANTDYYYFVAGDDGKTYFSKTIDEHNKAVADHCSNLCQ